MNTCATEILAKIDELQARYIDALDSKDMASWLNTFSDGDASYICRTAEAEKDNFGIAFILDDCRARLEDRISFVERVWVGTFQDYQTRHFSQRLSCKANGDDTYIVRSNVAVAFTRSDTGVTDWLISGVYLDDIKITADGAEFISKKLVVDAPLLPHYIVYPL